MIYLHNRTYVSIYKHNSLTTKSGIFLIPSCMAPRGACALGRVCGVGVNDKPVLAEHTEGDIVLFQKTAATGTGVSGYDLKLYNIDILARLQEGLVCPLNDYVVCEYQDKPTHSEGGILLDGENKKFNPFGIVRAIGRNVRDLVVGDRVMMDDLSGSHFVADNDLRITDVMDGVKAYLVYSEKFILAKESPL